MKTETKSRIWPTLSVLSMVIVTFIALWKWDFFGGLLTIMVLVAMVQSRLKTKVIAQNCILAIICMLSPWWVSAFMALLLAFVFIANMGTVSYLNHYDDGEKDLPR